MSNTKLPHIAEVQEEYSSTLCTDYKNPGKDTSRNFVYIQINLPKHIKLGIIELICDQEDQILITAKSRW